MFYLIPFAVAILIGLLRSRQPKVLMLWELKAVFLLPLGFFAGLLPFWLATYWPAVIWTEDRQLLMALQTSGRGLFLLFALINLVPALRAVDWPGVRLHFQTGRWLVVLKEIPHVLVRALNPRILKLHLKQIMREVWHDIRHLDIKLARTFSIHPRRILAESEALIPPPKANKLRLWGLVLALVALSGQLLVLLSNQGYWPITPNYLDNIADPLYVQGILNGSLRMQRLIDDTTPWAWLGQILPWPDFTPHAPAQIRYLSPTEPIMAISLFSLTLSLFPARQPKQKRGSY